MKNNAQYTAIEIINATGAEKFIIDEKEYSAEEVFGKVTVMIGGIRGIVDKNKILNIPSGTVSLDVMVGTSTFTISVEDNNGERELSAGVLAVRDGSST